MNKPKTFARYLPAKKTVLDGHKFDSRAEARRYAELKQLERAGTIRNIEIHPKFPMVVNGKKIGRGYMVLDFTYEELTDGTWVGVIEDVKSIDTDNSRTRRSVCEAVNDIKIRVVKR